MTGNRHQQLSILKTGFDCHEYAARRKESKLHLFRRERCKINGPFFNWLSPWRQRIALDEAIRDMQRKNQLLITGCRSNACATDWPIDWGTVGRSINARHINLSFAFTWLSVHFCLSRSLIYLSCNNIFNLSIILNRIGFDDRHLAPAFETSWFSATTATIRLKSRSRWLTWPVWLFFSQSDDEYNTIYFLMYAFNCLALDNTNFCFLLWLICALEAGWVLKVCEYNGSVIIRLAWSCISGVIENLSTNRQHKLLSHKSFLSWQVPVVTVSHRSVSFGFSCVRRKVCQAPQSCYVIGNFIILW